MQGNFIAAPTEKVAYNANTHYMGFMNASVQLGHTIQSSYRAIWHTMIKRRISTQFTLLFAFMLLGTLALLVTSTYTSHRVETRVEEITEQTLIVTSLLHEIRHAGSAITLSVSESIHQSLLAHPNKNALNPEAQARAEYDAQIVMIRDRLSQYSSFVDTYFPDETKTRDEILLISGALNRSSETILKRLDSANALNETLTVSQIQHDTDNFRSIEREFIAQIDAALAWESDELRERIETLNDTFRMSQQAVWIVFGALFLLVLFTGHLMVRKIINRIENLNGVVNDIGSFDLSARVEENGSDELSELAVHFNTMAQRLQDMNEKRDQDEIKLKDFNEQLHTLVDAQTKELRSAKDRAETASTAKTRFLSAMSHELRTPLNAILGYTQIIDINGANISAQDTKRHLATIMKSSEALLALIDEILTLSSMETETIPIQLRETSLLQVLKTSIDDVKAIALQNQVSIVNEVDATHLPRVLTNKDHLQKVFFNLLSNAVKYNHNGGGVIIKSSQVDGHNKVRITIKDTGEGFREAYPGQILEPFERLAFESSPIEGGGVGLTIVKRFLDNMEGELGYRSTPDQGSEFWVDLPAAVDLVSA